MNKESLRAVSILLVRQCDSCECESSGKKIEGAKESDAMGVRIQTAQDGERIGILTALLVDTAFLDRIGVLA